MANDYKNSSTVHLLYRLWQHITFRRRVQLGLVFILMIIASLAEVISIGAILPFLAALTAPEKVYTHPFAQPFIQLLEINEARQLMLPLTIVFSVAALVAGTMRLLLLWMQTRLSHAIGADFSIQVYRRTLYQPYAVHVARNSSEVITGVSIKANGVVNGIAMPVLTILSSLMILIAILMTLMAIDPTIAFISFAGFGGIYLIITLVVKGRLARASECISKESNQVVKALQEGLGGIRDVLIDGTQTTYCNIYRNADQSMRRAMAHVQIISICPRFGIEALGMTLIACLAYSLANKPGGVAEMLPVLGALAIGAQRILPVAQQIYSSLAHMRSGKGFLADVLDLLEQPLPAHASLPAPLTMSFENSITINKVSFRYANNFPWVLSSLNLTILKGNRVGFIGETGSGKSTLIDIIMALLYPVEGSLAIDGEIITPENYRSWQAQIAHVPQSIFLADTTIAENIAFGVPLSEIDYERVRMAARKAQISDTIESLDQQYHTRVGERGIRLSGGQRQRIGIARALYKQAKVIVFDEATSALDSETESAIMDAIDSLDKSLTILMIAHRLSTLKNCDFILEIVDGKIRYRDSYKKL